MKKHCPYCQEEIQAEAIKCRYCREWLAKEDDHPGVGSSTTPPAVAASTNSPSIAADSLSPATAEALNVTLLLADEALYFNAHTMFGRATAWIAGKSKVPLSQITSIELCSRFTYRITFRGLSRLGCIRVRTRDGSYILHCFPTAEYPNFRRLCTRMRKESQHFFSLNDYGDRGKPALLAPGWKSLLGGSQKAGGQAVQGIGGVFVGAGCFWIAFAIGSLISLPIFGPYGMVIGVVAGIIGAIAAGSSPGGRK